MKALFVKVVIFEFSLERDLKNLSSSVRTEVRLKLRILITKSLKENFRFLEKADEVSLDFNLKSSFSM